MGKLINIDNGGTLTDFCVFDDGDIYHTKALTTPYDLSLCFFDGLKKIALQIYGSEDNLDELLQSTDHIRYSTTQGTNALVERKGPRLGLIVENTADIHLLTPNSHEQALFSDLVGERIAMVDLSLEGKDAERNIVQAVNHIATAGANRIVLALSDPNSKALESRLCKLIGRKFPSHLLGVVPVVSAHELADDNQFKRRTWTALFNSFLHPAMERFLYNADQRLRDQKTNNPLLIYRNDGGSARVAKTMALKTYSSGPSGGMQGAKALAKHYGYSHLVTYDVGGTTTDVSAIHNGDIDQQPYGAVEKVETSFPFPTIHSAGVGGSSIISVKQGKICVGPQSVGAAPGPACFGLGGKQATITDVFLLLGILDPNTYFGGKLSLDEDKARDVITSTVADPLGITEFVALERMRDAWVRKIAVNISNEVVINDNTTLAGFGGAGALAATRIARATGVSQVIIPATGAIFSAFGIAFSPISQEYRVNVNSNTTFSETLHTTQQRAEKDLFAEGIDINECDIEVSLSQTLANEDGVIDNTVLSPPYQLPDNFDPKNQTTLIYKASKSIATTEFLSLSNTTPHAAVTTQQRTLLVAENDKRQVPIYSLSEQDPGAFAKGPAIIEDEFFTGFVDEGWSLSISGNNDLILAKII
ncbi:hydantoinase [Gammaproteobacteria bacterium 45_16_T64]|nr:hydantoinase [Gammaproteobacteria bacterium 45_16_T64]